LISSFFGDGFDGEIGGGGSGHVDDCFDAGEDGRLFGFGELPFLDFTVEIFAYGVESSFEESLVYVAKNDVVTSARKYVRDAVAHGAGAEHGHRFDRIKTHCRSLRAIRTRNTFSAKKVQDAWFCRDRSRWRDIAFLRDATYESS